MFHVSFVLRGQFALHVFGLHRIERIASMQHSVSFPLFVFDDERESFLGLLRLTESLAHARTQTMLCFGVHCQSQILVQTRTEKSLRMHL